MAPASRRPAAAAGAAAGRLRGARIVTVLAAASCLLVAALSTSASATASGTPPPRGSGLGPPIGSGGTLGDLLFEIVRIAGAWNPQGRASIAVVTSDGGLHGVNEDRQHPPASAVKALWTAAALDLRTPDAVAHLAAATLERSDNYAAGEVIDLAGIDAVADWTRDAAGLADTRLACWNYGRMRLARSALEGGGCGNRTTAADLALLYARLHGNGLLDPERTATLIAWLQDSPRGSTSTVSVGGALLARLPPAAAAVATHKAGWLPPGCCSNDHRLIIDAGGVPLPSGDWFTIAAIADRGRNYDRSVRWVGYAACRVYRYLAADGAHPCAIPGDPPP